MNGTRGADMATKYQDFLQHFFMQYRFNDMPVEVRAQFDDYKKEDLTGNMKKWREVLMQDDGHGNLVEKDLPEFTYSPANADEFRKLYKEFHEAFTALDENKDIYTNKFNFDTRDQDVDEFIKEFFGKDGVVRPLGIVVTDEINYDLETLKSICSGKHRSYIDSFLFDKGDLSATDIIKGIEKRKYLTDADFRKKLQRAAAILASATYEGSYNEDQQIKEALEGKSLSALVDGFKEKAVTDADLKRFSTSLPDMLEKLAKNPKLRAALNSSSVNTAYDAAKKYVGYDDKDSKDYVPPKHEEKLHPWQKFSRFVGKRWKDTKNLALGKRVYNAPQAENIVATLDKVKFKATDGLEGFLKLSKDIEEKIKPGTRGHFSWMMDALKEIKDNPTSKKTFKNALKSGSSMRNLVEELILKAVAENKMEEAKTAMEVLSTIRYGYTTSKTMDALRNEEFVLFSGDNLTWNKNEAMQFITRAMDKSIKYAFLSFGYATKAAVHTYHMANIKFRNKKSKRAQAAQDKDVADRTSAKNKEASTINTLIASDNAQIAEQERLKADTGIADDEEYRDINEKHKENTDALKKKRERLDKAREKFSKIKDSIEETKKQKLYQRYDERRQEIQDRLGEIEKQLELDTTALPDEERRVLASEKLKLMEELESMPKISAQQLELYNSLKRKEDALKSNEEYLKNEEGILKEKEEAAQETDSKLKKFEAAQERIQELTDHKTSMTEKLNELNATDPAAVDRVDELRRFWNKLETRGMFHIGKMWTRNPNATAKTAEFRAYMGRA